MFVILEPVLSATALMVSATLSQLFIIVQGKWSHGAHMQQDLLARQAQHRRPTPRIGGAAIILSFGLCVLFVLDLLRLDLQAALAAGLFIFIVGLREDIWRDVSPRSRLVAAFVSGALALGLSGQTVPGLGLSQVDIVLGVPLVAIAVTLLWSAGTCHALNLIDGLNGLAAGYALCAAGALCFIAGLTGDADIAVVAALLMAALAGFLVLNWPFGRIFMGDAGAYAIGHVLAWLGILLLARNPVANGFALLLVLFWPIGETTYSIIRRKLGRMDTSQPDRLHFHHIVVRALPLIFGAKLRGTYDNSLATLVLFPFVAAPILAGVLLWDDPAGAAAALCVFTALFIASYLLAIHLIKLRRLRRRGSLDRVQLAKSELPSTEISPFSGTYRDGVQKVEVRIFRPQGAKAWLVSTKASGQPHRLCNERFDCDRAAHREIDAHFETSDTREALLQRHRG